MAGTKAASSEATAFAAAHPDACELTDAGKVRFTLTGMEFPPSATSVLLQSYLHGKAVRRTLVQQRNAAYDFDAHLPHIAPHAQRNKAHFLWCRLTDRTLPRDCDVVRAHVEGRRFKAAVKKVEEKEKEMERIREGRLVKEGKRKAWNLANGKDGKGRPLKGKIAVGKAAKGGEEGMEVDASDAEMGSGDEAMDDDSGAGDEGAEEVDAEEESEDEDAFWTRGPAAGKQSRKSGKVRRERREAVATSASEDDDEADEWGDLPAKGEAKGKAAAAGPGKTGKKAAKREKRAPKGAARVPKVPDAGVKRKRDKASKVPKKSRRPTSRARPAATA